MNKRKVRDYFRLLSSILFFVIYIPHLLCYFANNLVKLNINKDLMRMAAQIQFGMPLVIQLLYFLHNNRYFRTLFYYRIGPICSLLIEWYRPGDRYFIIPKTTIIGSGISIAHPYATVLNADKIGENFSCIHCITIGKKNNKRPIIGNNVTLGAGVIIIGDIIIGDNVIIGAGSVVTKNIPDNCVVVGNPAKIIKEVTSC